MTSLGVWACQWRELRPINFGSKTVSRQGAGVVAENADESRGRPPLSTPVVLEMSSSILSESSHQSLSTPVQSRPPSPSRLEAQSEHDDSESELEGEEEQIEFGRGLANYNSQEIDKIKGHKR